MRSEGHGAEKTRKEKLYHTRDHGRMRTQWYGKVVLVILVRVYMI